MIEDVWRKRGDKNDNYRYLKWSLLKDQQQIFLFSQIHKVCCLHCWYFMVIKNYFDTLGICRCFTTVKLANFTNPFKFHHANFPQVGLGMIKCAFHKYISKKRFEKAMFWLRFFGDLGTTKNNKGSIMCDFYVVEIVGSAFLDGFWLWSCQ